MGCSEYVATSKSCRIDSENAAKEEHIRDRLSRLMPCSLPSGIFLFLFLFLLCMLFPYSGDDWTWGSFVGLDRLSSGFKDYNGRYAGNITVLVLTRSRLLRSLAMAAFLMSASCLITKIARGSLLTFCLSLFLISVIPVSLRAQGIVWTSGFANYATSTFFVLLYAYVFRGVFRGGVLYDARYPLPIFLMGVVGCLFIENVSLYFVGVSLAMLVYTRVRCGRWDTLQVCFLLGAIVGSILMFSNGNYEIVLSGGDELRKVESGGFVGSIVDKYASGLFNYICFGNGILNVILAFSVSFYYLSVVRNEASKGARVAWFASLAFLVAFSICSAYFSLVDPNYSPLSTGMKKALLSLGFLAVILVISLLTLRASGEVLPLFVVLSIYALVLPLLVVSPVGPRNFLTIYFLFILLSCWYLCNSHFVSCITERCSLRFSNHELSGIVSHVLLPAAVALCFAPWFLTYGEIALVDLSREVAVERGVIEDSSVIVIEKLPYSEGDFDSVTSPVWHANPVNGTWWSDVYKYYYEIPDAVELRLV